jgi:hypothetical protein
MPRGIFLIDERNQLSELVETPYSSEDLLQRLLADHPSVLAGDADEEGPRRRWLLIDREASVPDSADGSGRWSIDHVFLDQDAVPTLVEVKRSTDTRIRREVVGQMLDYAANALAYWPPEQLRSLHEARCSQRGVDPDEDLRAVLGESLEPVQFWERAKTNLTAGRIRLVFVSDDIPAELRRIVEFLNGQMDPAEVLAIEVRQYVGNRVRTLVPVVLGQTATAEQRKGVGPQGVQWDEARFMDRLTEMRGSEATDVARRILRWSEPRASRVWFGRGKLDGSFVPIIRHADVDHQMFAVYTSGQIEIYFQYYLGKPPFNDESLRNALRERLNAIPNVSIPADAMRRRPSILVTTLAPAESLDRFFEAFDWFRDQILKRA